MSVCNVYVVNYIVSYNCYPCSYYFVLFHSTMEEQLVQIMESNLLID